MEKGKEQKYTQGRKWRVEAVFFFVFPSAEITGERLGTIIVSTSVTDRFGGGKAVRVDWNNVMGARGGNLYHGHFSPSLFLSHLPSSSPPPF